MIDAPIGAETPNRSDRARARWRRCVTLIRHGWTQLAYRLPVIRYFRAMEFMLNDHEFRHTGLQRDNEARDKVLSTLIKRVEQLERRRERSLAKVTR